MNRIAATMVTSAAAATLALGVAAMPAQAATPTGYSQQLKMLRVMDSFMENASTPVYWRFCGYWTDSGSQGRIQVIKAARVSYLKVYGYISWRDAKVGVRAAMNTWCAPNYS